MGFPTRWVLLLFAGVLVGPSAPIHATPKVASLAAVLADATPSSENQGFNVYKWDLFPSILVIDTESYHVQDRMFSRLAFFLEKRGYRGRLLDNSLLETMHGWNAHDYGSDGLASFFATAQRLEFALNPEEIALRDLALDEGVVFLSHDQFAPGQGGVISISKSSSAIERRLLLTHESFHGIFFASEDYRAFCFALWSGLTPQTRSFFLQFLDDLGYDGSYQYLAVNEFQAYLVQQPLRYAPAYFERVMKRFAPKESLPDGAILKAARQLSAFTEAHFGIRAGDTVTETSPKESP